MRIKRNEINLARSIGQKFCQLVRMLRSVIYSGKQDVLYGNPAAVGIGLILLSLHGSQNAADVVLIIKRD